jgi:hypothetical protein
MYKISVKPHYMAWEILEQSGLIVKSGEQHNLVLNQAADLMAVHGMDGITAYAMVGTGTGAPVATQTQLQAELVRTNAVPVDESDSITRVSSGVYDIRRVRQFSAAQVGGQVLGEWGFSPAASGLNNAAVREVFRDGGGTPTPVVLTGTQQLRMIYVTRVDLNPKPAAPFAGSINISGVGNRAGLMYLCAGLGFGWRADFTVINGLITANANLQIDMHSARTAPNDNAINNGSAAKTLVVSGAFVAGSKTRAYQNVQWSTNDYSGVVTGFAVQVSGSGNGNGLAWMFDAGQEFNKASTHSLTLNSPFGVSWT